MARVPNKRGSVKKQPEQPTMPARSPFGAPIKGKYHQPKKSKRRRASMPTKNRFVR